MRNNFLTYSIAFLFTFIITYSGYGQSDFDTKPIWNKGKVKVRGKGVLQGEINLNLVHDLVRIRSENKEDQFKTYSPTQVDYFEFYDEELERKRVFYALPYQNEETKHFGPTFFELHKDAGDFALLSKDFYKIIESGGYSGGTPGTSINTPGGMVTTPSTPGHYSPLQKSKIENRKLYFVNRKGEILPYVVMKGNNSTENLIRGIIVIKNRKYIDKKALKKVTGNLYKSCMKYADDKNLNLKKTEDLLLLLDYYQKNN